MRAIKKMNLSAIEDRLSMSEMQEIQAGSGFCTGWTGVTLAIGAYGWWMGTSPVGWVGAGVLLAGDAYCYFR